MKEKVFNLVKPEHPRPDWQRREWLNLNGSWKFAFDCKNSGLIEQWYRIENCIFDDEIIVPFSWTSPLSGIGIDQKGAGWYSRKVNWTPEKKERRIFLAFGAVDYVCAVWINGLKAGSHTGGYGDFEFDVTELWNLETDNWIVVRVEDYDQLSQLRGKQGYGETRGIWQTPWLEGRPRSYVKSIRFTTGLDGTIEVTGYIMAGSSADGVLQFDFEGKMLHDFKIELSAGQSKFNTSFKIDNPKLWDLENPYLYEGTVSLISSGDTDEVNTYFGIREIGTIKYGNNDYPWITLNGKPIFLSGVLDQSFNAEGYFTYPSDQYIQDEIWRMKRLGLNFVRIHIKPEEPRKLYWADKLGILVMEDMPSTFGEPDEKAKEDYQREALEIINRDYNHPSIISWVMFNETWGLFTDMGEGSKQYLPETQNWVREIYEWGKREDSTRIIEDNSPCNYDHVVSDINTWHFYINGHGKLKEHLQSAVDKTYTGSDWNYIGGAKQDGAPLMNSECGAVWGVEGSAGDSDIAWQYHYMINEFRKHDKICGFVFTEFRDVVNEFNGYYRLDNSDKEFGYDWFCKDMSVKDLHSPDFLVIDAPPCSTAAANEVVDIPLLLSSFSDEFHGKEGSLEWQLWYDNFGEKVIADSGTVPCSWSKYGTSKLAELRTMMPEYDSIAVLSVALKAQGDKIISRNFVTFDVQSDEDNSKYDLMGSLINIKPLDYTKGNWEYSWTAINNNKLNGGDAGYFEYAVKLPAAANISSVSNMEVIFEAAAKAVLRKDKEMLKLKTRDSQTLDYMMGAKSDPEMNINSYFMTDDKKHPSLIEVVIEDEIIHKLYLPDDPADSRGVLSWHYQTDDRKLEEAGSYGYLQRVKVPSRLIPTILRKGSFNLRLQVPEGQGGLALYGRRAGHYPIDILVRYW
jgi:hypothetical protein